MPTPIPQAQNCFISRSPRRRGSALILAVMMAGILSVSIAAMLYNVRHLARHSSDKVAFEEAYQTAISGLDMGKSWLQDYGLAGAMFGSSSVETQLQALGRCFRDMSQDVIDNQAAVALLTPAEIVQTYFNRYGFVPAGTSLSDGRIVLYNFPANNGGIFAFHNDALTTPTASVMDKTGQIRSYVRRLRITTAYPHFDSSSPPGHGQYDWGTSTQGWTGEVDGLRRTSLIIEAEAIAVGQGIEKRRTAQQKLLIRPNLFNIGNAIVAGRSGIAVKGSSSLNVHWAPVYALGDIDLLDLSLNQSTKRLNAGTKFFGAGVNQGQGNEHWVHYLTAGRIYNKNGSNREPVFPTTITKTVGGEQVVVAVKDFMAQLVNGDFADRDANGNIIGGWYPSGTANFALAGNYTHTDPTLVVDLNLNNAPSLYSVRNGQAVVGSGAFIENEASIVPAIESITSSTMNYGYWKQYAITKGVYLRPLSGGGYANSAGQTLYVTPEGQVTTTNTGNSLDKLEEISMKRLVPSSGNTSKLGDRVLFIDTLEGTENGTKVEIKMGSNEAFFWKGVMYVNGHFSTSGSGGFPTVEGRNPDQFIGVESGTTPIAGCYLQGVLTVSGQLSRTGNAAIYGTLVAKEGYDGSGGPDVYFDSRNNHGELLTPVSSTGQPIFFASFDGPIVELGGWPG